MVANRLTPPSALSARRILAHRVVPLRQCQCHPDRRTQQVQDRIRIKHREHAGVVPFAGRGELNTARDDRR